MNRGIFYKLYFLRHMPEFLEIRASIESDRLFQDAVKKLELYYSEANLNQHKYEISVPYNIDWMILRSMDAYFDITIVEKMSDEEFIKNLYSDKNTETNYEIWKYKIDWENLREEIKDFYEKEEYSHLLSNEAEEIKALKDAAYISLLKSEIMLPAIKKGFEVIDCHFKLSEFGPPTYEFLCELISSLLGEYNVISENQRISMSNDLNKWKLVKENQYLRKKLHEVGVNVDKEMMIDGFAFDVAIYDKLASGIPFCYIHHELADKEDIESAAIKTINNNPNDKKAKGKKSSSENKARRTMRFETFEILAARYVEPVFNEGMTVLDIIKRTYPKYGIKQNFSTVRDAALKDLKLMADLAGFRDLLDKILEENKTVARLKKS